MNPINLPTMDPKEARRQRRQYGTGLAIGMIPVILTLIVPGYLFVTHSSGPYAGLNAALALLIVAAVVYLFEIIVMFTLLANPAQRFRGYGLLTMVFAGPDISYSGCVVLPQLFAQH